MNTRLFLIQDSGPTSFVLKNQDGKKFKVNIGSMHSCSCGGGRKNHCIHTLFCLVKIYRLDPCDPLIYQLSFIDSEVQKLISMRHGVIQNNNQQKNRERKTYKKEPEENFNKKNSRKRVELKNDDICPICQDEMTENDDLTWCRNSCGRNIHVECMKHWAEHKVQTSDPITCPLCRDNWGPYALHQIKDDMIECRVRKKEKIKVKLHYGCVCNFCKMSPIYGMRFKCV